jgi:glycosyltransferase involved in cell wall biosynthesis
MPAFNAGRYIQSAIDSILAQTEADLELIVYDNASADDTEAVCRAAADRDPRVRYHRNPENLGAAENYNLVLKAARGRYFRWCSSNDLCHPEFLRSCVDRLEEQQDAVLAYPDTWIFSSDPAAGTPFVDSLALDDDDPVVRFTRFLDGVRLNNLINGVCRTEVLRNVPPIRVYFGSDLVTAAALTFHGKLVRVPFPYFYRRMDEHSATRLVGEEAARRHYDPAGRKRMVFQTFRLYAGYLGAAASAPLPSRVRARLCGAVLRRMVWARHGLAQDAWQSLARLARRG